MVSALKYDEPFSNFAFNFKLRRYTKVPGAVTGVNSAVKRAGRDLGFLRSLPALVPARPRLVAAAAAAALFTAGALRGR